MQVKRARRNIVKRRMHTNTIVACLDAKNTDRLTSRSKHFPSKVSSSHLSVLKKDSVHTLSQHSPRHNDITQANEYTEYALKWENTLAIVKLVLSTEN